MPQFKTTIESQSMGRQENFFTIGIRRPIPKATFETLGPGQVCRRLNSIDAINRINIEYRSLALGL